MTYSVGGRIQTTDYNGFVASVNALWGVGSGNSGYGQTNPLSTVAARNVVTAAQWSTLIARINSMRQHQSGVTSGLTSPVAGDVITYLSTMSGQISTCTTNKLLSDGVGETTAAAASAYGNWYGESFADRICTMTFASANQMRYFFNSGGRVEWNAANSFFQYDSERNIRWERMAADLATQTITGSNFYNMTTSYVSYATATGYSDNYGTNTLFLQARLNAAPGSSTILYLRAYFADDAANLYLYDAAYGTPAVQATAYQPATPLYLAKTWGTITGGNNNTVTQA